MLIRVNEYIDPDMGISALKMSNVLNDAETPLVTAFFVSS